MPGKRIALFFGKIFMNKPFVLTLLSIFHFSYFGFQIPQHSF